MIKNYIENANFEDTGFAYTLSLISGKHKARCWSWPKSTRTSTWRSSPA